MVILIVRKIGGGSMNTEMTKAKKHTSATIISTASLNPKS